MPFTTEQLDKIQKFNPIRFDRCYYFENTEEHTTKIRNYFVSYKKDFVSSTATWTVQLCSYCYKSSIEKWEHENDIIELTTKEIFYLQLHENKTSG